VIRPKHLYQNPVKSADCRQISSSFTGLYEFLNGVAMALSHVFLIFGRRLHFLPLIPFSVHIRRSDVSLRAAALRIMCARSRSVSSIASFSATGRPASFRRISRLLSIIRSRLMTRSVLASIFFLTDESKLATRGSRCWYNRPDVSFRQEQAYHLVFNIAPY